jgi:hypothetical protein
MITGQGTRLDVEWESPKAPIVGIKPLTQLSGIKLKDPDAYLPYREGCSIRR